MSYKKSVVAVLPDGTEHFEEITSEKSFSYRDYEGVCENAVSKAKLKTPRNNPVAVNVDLFSLEIKNGKLERRKINTYGIVPQLERMTDDEYNAEMKEILSEIPQEFHSYVWSESYDRGHSDGMEGCVNIAVSIVSALKPCIKEFRKNIM